MKTIFSFLLCSLFLLNAADTYSQCSGRYYDKIFPGFYDWRNPVGLPSLNTPVVYGSAVNYVGATETLDMYVFQPQGDTASKRPLLVLAFGGSFTAGFKESPDILALCDEFTRRGFVTVSIKYRLGSAQQDSVNMLKAVVRGVQDAKAAIRFFYKDAATTNTYRIDTNNIFMGGTSAGAFIGVHLGYIQDTVNLPQWFKDLSSTVGGLEGTSGTPGYSSKIKGIINLAGAIGDTAWITADGPLMVSMHGDEDGTVPYCSDVVLNIIEVDGSAVMKQRTANLGVKNPFYTWRNADHVPYVNFTIFTGSDPTYMDTTIWFVRDFLFEMLTGNKCGQGLKDFGRVSNPCGQEIIEPIEVGIKPVILNNDFVIYPNPSEDVIYIEKPKGFSGSADADIYDSMGRLVKSYSDFSDKLEVKRDGFESGLYLVRIRTKGANSGLAAAKVIFR